MWGLGRQARSRYSVSREQSASIVPNCISGRTANVGIGTAGPSAPLEISGGSNGVVQKISSTGVFTALHFTNTSGDGYIGLAGATGGNLMIGGLSYATVLMSNNSTALQLGTNGTARVTIDTYGNVGVATLAAGASNSLCYNTTAIAGENTLATCSSDQRLKQNITPLDSSSTLAQLMELNPVSFNWNPQFATSLPEQFELIAQQVQQVWPNLVSTTSPTSLTPDGTLSLNFNGLFGPIVSAIQALYTDVESLEQTVAGFAQSFTSEVGNFGKVNTQQLCITNSAGQPVCVTGDQLAALLASKSSASNTSDQSPPAAQPSPSGESNLPESVTQNSASTTPPTITINGDNPAIIQVGDSYADLGATVTDTGPGQAGDTNLGLKTFLNGTLVSNIVIDTSQVATDTIDYVATDTDGLTATSTRTVLIEAAATSSSQ